MAREREEIRVPVAGGELAVSRWAAGPDAPTVLAAHGITSNSLSWANVAELLPDVTILAPDLRGRAHSGSLPGPYGIASHVADLIAVLDHADIAGPVTLAGHSMGGFVAALAAVRHPDRFGSVVLVDGGLGFPMPEGDDTDAILRAAIGPSIERLTRQFADRTAYHDFFKQNPALRDHWNADVEAYVDRDLVGEPPALHSSASVAAVSTDGAQILRDPEILGAFGELTVPATLLWAPRGMFDQEGGLYPAELIERSAGHVRTTLVPDTNHYTILLGKGAGAVAGAIREQSASPNSFR